MGLMDSLHLSKFEFYDLEHVDFELCCIKFNNCYPVDFRFFNLLEPVFQKS